MDATAYTQQTTFFGVHMKINANLVTSLVILAILQGCTTTTPKKKSENIRHSYIPVHIIPTIVDLPKQGTTTTVEVGESLISKEEVVKVPAIDLNQVVYLPSDNVGVHFALTALPGKYLEKGRDGDGIFYQAEKDKFLYDGKPLTESCGIYVPNVDASNTELYCLSMEGDPISYPKADIKFTKSVSVVKDDVNFRKELVYTGVSENVISVVYREFTDKSIRPVVTHALSYDLKQDNIVGYQGARFKVVKATNQGITFTTIKPLN
jgi:hypothetical protein